MCCCTDGHSGRKALFLCFAVLKLLGLVSLGSHSEPRAVPHGWVQSKYCLWSWNMNMKHANSSIN